MADDPPKQKLILHLMISGRVQGVSYRVWLRAEAHVRGVTGWTRNRANGDVEAVVAGAPEDVQTLVEICRCGPPMARVDQILVEEVDVAALQVVRGETGFAILPTL